MFFDPRAAQQTQAKGMDDQSLRQMLAMGLMQGAGAKNDTIDRGGANANILAQALMGGMGGYMYANAAKKPNQGAFGILNTNRGSGD